VHDGAQITGLQVDGEATVADARVVHEVVGQAGESPDTRLCIDERHMPAAPLALTLTPALLAMARGARLTRRQGGKAACQQREEELQAGEGRAQPRG